MVQKKRKRRRWRHALLTRTYPDINELPVVYKNLIGTVTDIITGKRSDPVTLHFNFYKTLSYKVFKQTKTWTPHTLLLLRVLIDRLPHLSREDIEQQAWLYLLEMWKFYSNRRGFIRSGASLFYDYVRVNLVRYMSAWMANQILMASGDHLGPVFSEETYLDEPEEFKLSLNWVILKKDTGRLCFLSTRQKYLVFLRYAKQMTTVQIAELTHQHRATVEQDFSIIKQLIGDHDDTTRNYS